MLYTSSMNSSDIKKSIVTESAEILVCSKVFENYTVLFVLQKLYFKLPNYLFPVSILYLEKEQYFKLDNTFTPLKSLAKTIIHKQLYLSFIGFSQQSMLRLEHRLWLTCPTEIHCTRRNKLPVFSSYAPSQKRES